MLTASLLPIHFPTALLTSESAPALLEELKRTKRERWASKGAQCVKALATKLTETLRWKENQPSKLFSEPCASYPFLRKLLRRGWSVGSHLVICMWVHLCHHAHEDNMLAWVPYLHQVCSKSQIQAISLGRKHLYAWSHLAAGPMLCSWWQTMGWRERSVAEHLLPRVRP